MSEQKKACLVVGAGDATGGAISKRFAREGYTVVPVRRKLELEEDCGRGQYREDVVGVTKGQIGEPEEPAGLHALHGQIGHSPQSHEHGDEHRYLNIKKNISFGNWVSNWQVKTKYWKLTRNVCRFFHVIVGGTKALLVIFVATPLPPPKLQDLTPLQNFEFNS